jgi:hypothetical protein
MGGRHDLYPHPVGLVASGGVAGFVLTQAGWLVDGRSCDDGIASIGAVDGDHAAQAQTGAGTLY